MVPTELPTCKFDELPDGVVEELFIATVEPLVEAALERLGMPLEDSATAITELISLFDKGWVHYGIDHEGLNYLKVFDTDTGNYQEVYDEQAIDSIIKAIKITR